MTGPAVFQKRPTQVQAMRWTGDNFDDLSKWGANNTYPTPIVSPTDSKSGMLTLWVEARSSWVDVEIGEWIILNEHGFISASPALFGHLYERVFV